MIASGGGTTSLKKAARNAPKCRASRLCRAGVFVPVVAKPIQDTSEVSIPIKTVGIRLSRLWCGAVARLTKRPLTESDLLLPRSKNETLP